MPRKYTRRQRGGRKNWRRYASGEGTKNKQIVCYIEGPDLDTSQQSLKRQLFNARAQMQSATQMPVSAYVSPTKSTTVPVPKKQIVLATSSLSMGKSPQAHLADAATNVQKAATEAGNTVANQVNEGYKKATDTVKSMGTTLTEGVKNAAVNLGNQIKSLGESGTDVLANAAAKTGLSTKVQNVQAAAAVGDTEKLHSAALQANTAANNTLSMANNTPSSSLEGFSTAAGGSRRKRRRRRRGVRRRTRRRVRRRKRTRRRRRRKKRRTRRR